MWKSSARSKGSKGSGGKKDGSVGLQTRTDSNNLVDQQPPDSVLEIAIDGNTSTSVEDGKERGGRHYTNAQNGGLSPIRQPLAASQGGKMKFLQMFKRKVKTSPDDHSLFREAKDGSKRNSGTQRWEIPDAPPRKSSVDQLEEELLALRRRLDREEAEMQELRMEVSSLRIGPASPGHTSGHASRDDSIGSDASQLSCLDFTLGSTGNLKFEGKIKTRVSPVSDLKMVEREDFTDICRYDTQEVATHPAENIIEVKKVEVKKVEVKKVVDSAEVAKTAEASALSQGTGQDAVDNSLETNRETLHDSRKKSNELDYVEKYCNDHNSADLKLLGAHEDASYGNTQRQITEKSKTSRSPPKSVSSGSDELDLIVYRSVVRSTSSDADDSSKDSRLQKGDELQATKIICAATAPLAGLVADEIMLATETKDQKEANEKISVSIQAKNSWTGQGKSNSSKSPAEAAVKAAVEAVRKGRMYNSSRLSFSVRSKPPSVPQQLKAVKPLSNCYGSDSDSKVTVMYSEHKNGTETSDLDNLSSPVEAAVGGAVRAEKLLVEDMNYQTEVEEKTPLGIQMKDSWALEGSSNIKWRTERMSKPALPSAPEAAVKAAVQAARGGHTYNSSSSFSSRAKLSNFQQELKIVKPSSNINWTGLDWKALNLSTTDVSELRKEDEKKYGTGNISTSPRSPDRKIDKSGPRQQGFSSSISPKIYCGTSSNISAGFTSPDDSDSKPEFDDYDWLQQYLNKPVDELDLEEEVRQCLEESRLLLMAPTIGVGEKSPPSPSSPSSRDQTVSVLALSRQRRNVAKSPVSPKSHQQRDWPQAQDKQAIVLYEDDNSSHRQSGTDSVLALSRQRRNMEKFRTTSPRRYEQQEQLQSQEQHAIVLYENPNSSNMKSSTVINDVKLEDGSSSNTESSTVSVLALSRQRRTMEKSRTFGRERHTQQERLPSQEQHAIVFLHEHSLSIMKSSTVSNDLNSEEQGNENTSFLAPQSLRSATDSWDRRLGQPCYELESQDSIPRNPFPRRSRFYLEANSRRFSASDMRYT